MERNDFVEVKSQFGREPYKDWVKVSRFLACGLQGVNVREIIDNEITYPIYKFSVTFTLDGSHDKYKDSPRFIKDLPEGRIRDFTGFSKMFKEEKSEEELTTYFNEWWERYKVNEKNNSRNLEIESFEIKYSEHETWFLTWFQHETFDVGQTDEEALQSFERFVSRKQTLNERENDGSGLDKYCLMGAEDRWRWRGADRDGELNDEHSSAPCRCRFCKEQGVLRIDH